MNSKEFLYAVALQPCISQNDFRDSYSFSRKTSFLMEEISSKIEKLESTRSDRRSRKLLVVFPEMFGTWLVLLNENWMIFHCPFIWMAFALFIALHCGSLLSRFSSEMSNWFRSLLQRKGRREQFSIGGCVKRSIFLLKSEEMFSIYTSTFSELSRKHRCYIVAGSVFLPRLVLDNRSRFGVRLTNEGLFNVSLTFDPNGMVCHIVHKCFLIPEEKSYVNAGRPEDIQVCHTKFGNLGVLICADSWIPLVYERLKQQQVQLIAVCCFVSPAKCWNCPWKGYSVGFTPPFVDHSDIGTAMECDMWDKYAVKRWVDFGEISLAVTSHCNGHLWEMTAGGQSNIIYNEKTLKSSSGENHEESVMMRVDLPICF